MKTKKPIRFIQAVISIDDDSVSDTEEARKIFFEQVRDFAEFHFLDEDDEEL